MRQRRSLTLLLTALSLSGCGQCGSQTSGVPDVLIMNDRAFVNLGALGGALPQAKTKRMPIAVPKAYEPPAPTL